jgi:F0F1-type ATP synthase assembly protein I
MIDPKKEEKKVKSNLGVALELAFNLGYLIIIPMILFGVGGVILDKYLGTTPIFIFVGFLLGMTSAIIVIFKKMKNMVVVGIPQVKINKYNKDNK